MTYILIFILGACFTALILREGEKLPYHFYVVYFCKKDGFSANGSMTIDRNHKMRSWDDIKSLQEFIQKEAKVTDVIITNWIKIKK